MRAYFPAKTIFMYRSQIFPENVPEVLYTFEAVKTGSWSLK